MRQAATRLLKIKNVCLAARRIPHLHKLYLEIRNPFVTFHSFPTPLDMPIRIICHF
jgi:hypothetical protein